MIVRSLAIVASLLGCSPRAPSPAAAGPATVTPVAAAASPAPTPTPTPGGVAGYCFAPGDGSHPTLCELDRDACDRFRAEFHEATPCSAHDTIFCAYTPDGDHACGVTEGDCESARNLVEDTRGCGPVAGPAR